MKTLLSAVLLIAVSAWGQSATQKAANKHLEECRNFLSKVDDSHMWVEGHCVAAYYQEVKPKPHKPKPSVKPDSRDGACFGCDGKKGSPPLHIVAPIDPCDGWSCTKPVEDPKNCQHEDEGVWPCALMAPDKEKFHLAAAERPAGRERATKSSDKWTITITTHDYSREEIVYGYGAVGFVAADMNECLWRDGCKLVIEHKAKAITEELEPAVIGDLKPSVLPMKQLGPGKIHDGTLFGKWDESCDAWACLGNGEIHSIHAFEAEIHAAACKHDPNEEGCGIVNTFQQSVDSRDRVIFHMTAPAEVEQWGDWPPDQHVSKPGDAPEGRCQEDSTGECFDERRKIVPCWRADQIAPCAAIVEPDKAAVPVEPCSIHDYYGRCDRESSKRHDEWLDHAFSEYMSCMDQTESEGCYFRARETNGLQESDFHRYFPEGPPITDAEMYRILNERMARVGCRREYSEEFCQTHVDAYQRFGKIYKAK